MSTHGCAHPGITVRPRCALASGIGKATCDLLCRDQAACAAEPSIQYCTWGWSLHDPTRCAEMGGYIHPDGCCDEVPELYCTDGFTYTKNITSTCGNGGYRYTCTHQRTTAAPRAANGKRTCAAPLPLLTPQRHHAAPCRREANA